MGGKVLRYAVEMSTLLGLENADDKPESSNNDELLGDLIKRQKKERKDLQAKLTALKHSIKKNDKKAKKELLVKMVEEERVLECKHKDELKEFELHNAGMPKNEKVCEVAEHSTVIGATENNEVKLSKAAKRRLVKEQLAKEHDQLLAESESQAENTLRMKERQAFESILSAKNLSMVDIAADGDCLFNAVAHQLGVVSSITVSAKELRRLAAETMRLRRSDFEPFVECDKGDFAAYCDRMEKTSTWGGHLELKALSAYFQRPILVLRADGNETQLGASGPAPPLVIAYLKHELDSGPHYNSTEPVLQ